MSDLIGTSSEDLRARWSQVLSQYKVEIVELKTKLYSVGRIYNELLVLSKEMKSRGLEVDDNCLEEMRKIS